MDLGAGLIGFSLLLVSTLFVIGPFRRTGESSPLPTGPADPQPDPKEQRKALLLAVRDLDFDYQVGKIAQEDYTGLRSDLITQAAEMVQKEDLEEAKREEGIEALIRRRREALSGGKVCGQCRRPLKTEDRFCPGCGTPVGKACPSCGQALHPGDVFCGSCGTRLAVDLTGQESRDGSAQ